jgi:hypothetical protein
MQDLLESAQTWLADQFHEHVAKQVTYRRGVDEVVVRATVGRTLLKLDDGYGGVRMVWTDRDYLIRAVDLVIGGNPAQPQRGDQIREVVSAGALIHEVLAPGEEPPWRWADPHRQMFRIHTKHIATEA